MVYGTSNGPQYNIGIFVGPCSTWLVGWLAGWLVCVCCSRLVGRVWMWVFCAQLSSFWSRPIDKGRLDFLFDRVDAIWFRSQQDSGSYLGFTTLHTPCIGQPYLSL